MQVRSSHVEEMHRGKVRVQRHAEPPCPPWVLHPPSASMCPPTRSSWSLIVEGFLLRFQYIDMAD